MAKKKADTQEIKCIVDRIPLPDGTVLVTDQTAFVSPEEAAKYVTNGWAENV